MLLSAVSIFLIILFMILRTFIDMWSLGNYLPFNYDAIMCYTFIVTLILVTVSFLIIPLVILRCPACGGLMARWKFTKGNRRDRRGSLSLIPILRPPKCIHCGAPLCHELVEFSQCSCGEKVPGESQYCLKCGEEQWNK